MAKTFKEIRIMLANTYMSNIDPDDMSTEEEEKTQVVRSLDSTHVELMGSYDFSFLRRKLSYSTVANQKEYRKPDGKIKAVYVNNTKLTYKDDGFLLEEKTGKPTYFWVSDNNKKIVLYPTPDKVYTVKIQYMEYRYALTADGTPTDEYEDTCTINMPEWMQKIYIEWLIYQTLGDYLRNQARPRWQPTLQIAQNKKRIFLQQSKAYDGELRFEI